MDDLTILLDMDGVCCDFVNSTFKLIEREDLINKWPENAKNIEEATEIAYIAIWKKIDEQGDKFWRNLPEYPWYKDLYNTLKNLGRVNFCSSPSWDSNCLKGKVEWLQDRYGKGFRDYALTNKKYLLAKENTILIDDTEKKCVDFIKHGGRAILFPQDWNCGRGIKDKVRYISERIRYGY